jgi:NifU-like protein involved in Fe-S cluster formation
MNGAATLYSRELLGLAVSLADWPYDAEAPLTGSARSATCGSTTALSASLDRHAHLIQPGLRVTACAVGQAAAAIFAAHAEGRTRGEIATARNAIADWLRMDGPMPDWPGFAVLEPVRAYPGRHGAVLLAWDAALAALPKQTGGS